MPVRSAFIRPGLALQCVLAFVVAILFAPAPSFAQITIDVLPRIVVQPQPATIGKGANVRFSVLAAAPGGTGTLHYQWYRGTTALAGQTSPTLELTNVQAGASYQVRVRNNYGSRNSSIVALSVVENAWAELGGRPMLTSAANTRPSLALCGAPHVAWINTSNTGVGLLYVSRFDGAGWVPVGSGVLNVSSSASASSPSLDCFAGRPVVAWREASATGQNIYTAAWTGTQWARLRDTDNVLALNFTPGSHAAAPIIRVHPQGAGAGSIATDSAIAWIEGATVHVRRWNGSAWERYGSGSFGVSNGTANPVAEAPGVGLSFVEPGSTDVVVAWAQRDGNGQDTILTTFWRNAAWYTGQTLVRQVPAGAVVSNVAVGVEKFDLFKAPVTVWTEHTTSTRVHSRKMDQAEFNNPAGMTAPWSEFVPPLNAGNATAFAFAPQAFGGDPCSFSGGFPALSLLTATSSGFQVRQSRCTTSNSGWADTVPQHPVPIERASLAMQDAQTAIVLGVQPVNGNYRTSVWRYYASPD